jgi:CheY-like chemotaxis protein
MCGGLPRHQRQIVAVLDTVDRSAHPATASIRPTKAARLSSDRGTSDAKLRSRTPTTRLHMPSDQTVRESSSFHWPRTAAGDLIVAKVAIADDDPEALELLCRILRSPTIEICKAQSGAELVVLLAEQGPFDLIVTDIDMPWMEGLAVVRSARAAEIRAPVLFVSGVARPGLSAAVERLGNSRLLRKPIAVSALREAIGEMLGGMA